MSELLVNGSNQPVEIHLADNVVVVLAPRERTEIQLGDGPHPQLDELIRRMVVSVIGADAGGGPDTTDPRAALLPAEPAHQAASTQIEPDTPAGRDEPDESDQDA